MSIFINVIMEADTEEEILDALRQGHDTLARHIDNLDDFEDLDGILDSFDEASELVNAARKRWGVLKSVQN